MKSRRLFTLTVLATSVIALTACSSSGNKAPLPNGYQGTTSMGLGNEEGFGGAGNGEGDGYTTRAPANQTYHFDFNSNEVHQEYLPSIDAQANYLTVTPTAKIVLNGHTDERGSREYNIALGERRAQAVANRLLTNGTDRQQIRIVSYGSEKPAVPGHSEAAYAKNRRVQLIYEDLGK